MRWLLLTPILLAVTLDLSESAGGFFDNLDDWEDSVGFLDENPVPFDDEDSDEDAGRSIVSKLKSFKVKKKCGCQESACGCCVFTMFNDETPLTACFNMEQAVCEKVDATLVINEKKIFTKKIGEKKKCAKVPFSYGMAKGCLLMYKVSVDKDGMHACLKLHLSLLTKEMITVDFNCLRLANKKISTEKPSGRPNTGLINLDVTKVNTGKLKLQVKSKHGKFFKDNYSKFKKFIEKLFKPNKDKNKTT